MAKKKKLKKYGDGGNTKPYKQPSAEASKSFMDDWSGVTTIKDIKPTVTQAKADTLQRDINEEPLYIRPWNWNKPATGKIEESISPIDLVGTGIVSGVAKLGTKALQNTYKINPWAFKTNPEAFYRQIGETGIKDALESNVIRSADKYRFPRPHFVEGKDFKKLYSTGSGAHGKPSVIFETSGINKEGLPFVNPVNANSSYTPWVADMSEVPLSEGKILQKDWLQGYKEVPKVMSKKQFKNGGKLAYCKDGGEIDFTYIFSDALGTAPKAQATVKKYGGRLPADFLHVVDGASHPANGAQGGAQYDANMRPVDATDIKFNGMQAKGKKYANISEPLPGAVAFLENGEVFKNPKYNGILPYGTDPIAFNSSDREFTRIEAENEKLRMGKNGGKMFGWGGTAATWSAGTANELPGAYDDSINMADTQGGGRGMGIMSTVGGMGSAVGGMAGEDTEQADAGWQATREQIAQVNPMFGMFHGIAKAGEGIGQSIGGEKGGNVASSFLDPFGRQMEVMKGDYTKKQKFIAAAVPFAAGFLEQGPKAFRKKYKQLDMNLTQNTAGNEIAGYKNGGKLPMHKKGKDSLSWLDTDYINSQANTDLFGNSFFGPQDIEINKIDPASVQATYPNWGLKLPPAGTTSSKAQRSGLDKGDTYTEVPSLPYFDPTLVDKYNTNYSVAVPGKESLTKGKFSPEPPDQFGLTTGDKLTLSSMLPATLFNAANFAAGYDREKAILNPEANKIKSLMDQKIDFQAMLNEARAERNRSEGFINRSTDNQAVRRANLLQSSANAARTASGINLQGQMAQNQLDTSRAQMLDQLGRETMQAKETARELTARNKGQWLNWGSATAENIGEGLSRTGAAMNTREMNNLKIKLLNSLPGNYKLDKKFMKKYNELNDTESLFNFIATYKSE